MIAVKCSKKWKVINIVIFKNDALSKIVDTPVKNGLPSLFRIDGVHPMEISISYALLVYFDQ
jgi:hypothetical protein